TFTIRNNIGGVPGLQWWMPRIVRTLANHMLSKDEPDHKRLRDIVDEAFRRRAVLEMEPRILAIADELADGLFAAGSPTDLVDSCAQAAVVRDLRASRFATRGPAEIQRLGERLYAADWYYGSVAPHPRYFGDAPILGKAAESRTRKRWHWSHCRAGAG